MKAYKITTFLAVLAVLTACEKALDQKVDNTYGNEDTWRIPAKARGVLMNAYAGIGDCIDAYSNDFLDCATDNGLTNAGNSAVYKVSQGGITVGSNPIETWSMAYAQFTNIHLFLENGLGDHINYNISDEKDNAAWQKLLYGEAHFLRAWWGWQLLRMYGGKVAGGEVLGYPIVLDSKSGYEFKARDSYEACVKQIVADCEEARLNLPEVHDASSLLGVNGKGRATSVAAVALKAIVYLTAASEAYQHDGISASEAKDKWERAANAAYEAVQITGKPIYLTPQAWTGAASNLNEEFLLALVQNAGKGLENRNYPPYYYGQGQTNPSQNLVDAFPMKNGYPISDERAGLDEFNPYANRDNRLSMSVLHNQSVFQGKSVDVFAGGKDSYATDTRATRTGYYLRKWLVEDVDLTPTVSSNKQHVYPLIRVTELWLAFAEAANMAWGPKVSGPETGNLAAYQVIKDLRSGSGGITSTEYLDEVAADGTEAFDRLILNERRIELAFENHRYFDIRRRKLFDAMTADVTGVRVTAAGGVFTYTPVMVEKRLYNPALDLYTPIPHNEIIKNPMLKQNLGW